MGRSPSGEERSTPEYQSDLEKKFERFHAESYGIMHLACYFRAPFHSWLSSLERWTLFKLGFHHQVAEASRRKRRRHGQRHSGERQVAATGRADRRPGGIPGRGVPGGVWRENVFFSGS